VRGLTGGGHSEHIRKGLSESEKAIRTSTVRMDSGIKFTHYLITCFAMPVANSTIFGHA